MDRAIAKLGRTLEILIHQQPQESPGLTIFNTGAHFIRCIPVLPRDKIKTDDVDTNAEDHIGDESRYAIGMPTFQPGHGFSWKV